MSIRERLQRLQKALALPDPGRLDGALALSDRGGPVVAPDLASLGLVPASRLPLPPPRRERRIPEAGDHLPDHEPLSCRCAGPLILTSRHGAGTRPAGWAGQLETLAGSGRLPLDTLDRRLGPAALEGLLVLDTETTGLSGGAGTVAFLIGLAWMEAGEVHVEQLMMKDFPDEDAMLDALSARIEACEVVVTYNGKSFDMPLLEGRLVANRRRPWGSRPHLDLLPVTRRLWRRRIGDCSLQSVERTMLDLHRMDDIPSHLIPLVYFRYLQDPGTFLMERVLDHNRQDVLSLVGVLARTLSVVVGPARPAELPFEDLLSLAIHFEGLGDHERALALYREATGTPGARSAWGLHQRHAMLLKKLRRWEEAVRVWGRMIELHPERGAYPYVELAKHLEHRQRDPAGALDVTRQALRTLGSGLYGTLAGWDEIAVQLQHRRRRLEARLEAAPRRRNRGEDLAEPPVNGTG